MLSLAETSYGSREDVKGHFWGLERIYRVVLELMVSLVKKLLDQLLNYVLKKKNHSRFISREAMLKSR